MDIHQIIQFLIKYKYEAIFPVAVVEGPIITIVSGFLISLGHLDFFPALLVVFSADVISDSFYYFLGKGGRHLVGRFKFLQISEERIEKIENQFKSSPWKTMILAKISYGLGGSFMAASGASRMPWDNFIEYVVSLNILRSSVLLAIGFYFGKIALHFGPTYLQYYTTAIIILVPLGLFIYNKKFKKTSKNMLQ